MKLKMLTCLVIASTGMMFNAASFATDTPSSAQAVFNLNIIAPTAGASAAFAHDSKSVVWNSTAHSFAVFSETLNYTLATEANVKAYVTGNSVTDGANPFTTDLSIGGSVLSTDPSSPSTLASMTADGNAHAVAVSFSSAATTNNPAHNLSENIVLHLAGTA